MAATRKRPNRSSATRVEAITHVEDKRPNIPTSELAAVAAPSVREAVRVAYERRNRDLDPQLVWRGKDEQDWTDLIVDAPPLYIEEKVHPKALIDDLIRHSDAASKPQEGDMVDMFADFNGLPEGADKTDFYRHEGNWSNRLILGDSLRVMASLAEREGLRGKVQCIYVDPPYGIRFNSNFQWSTTSRDVRDGNAQHITREPEQVKAFRDTWRDGIHSYLTYLRDRLTVARDLLTDSGSVFVQIGDENVHRVRALMDEVFGEGNFLALISFRTHSPLGVSFLPQSFDYIVWYSKDRSSLKYHQLHRGKEYGDDTPFNHVERPDGERYHLPRGTEVAQEIERGNSLFRLSTMSSSGYTPSCTFPFPMDGDVYRLQAGKSWRTTESGMIRLRHSNRLYVTGSYLNYVQRHDDFRVMPINNSWDDVYTELAKQYVVQTSTKVIARCILMTTDPGDLVLDPTCGSGTTAYVSEQWGRRWITIDTSRVALALARARIMGARYPYYLLADSQEGQEKEAEVTRRPALNRPTHGDVRQGFVYERVPHVTLRDIANNAEIDVIWETSQETMEALREALNAALGENWEEWEIPREAGANWSEDAREAHRQWWEARIKRQQEIDASIAAKAAVEYLYDKPYTDNKRVRVAGPFTVETLSPHRVAVADDAASEGADADAAFGASPLGQRRVREAGPGVRYAARVEERDFAADMLEQLRRAGIQQAHKEDKITFTAVNGWAGKEGYVCAEGRYIEGETERRAGFFIGPEFGTVSRPDLAAAAREAREMGFDVLIACAFSYDARASDLDKLGSVRVLKARMNADLHMATDLKSTDKANLFVVFGEPDIAVEEADHDMVRVRVLGVDIYRPEKGMVESSEPDDLACWFIDTDYDEESFFVRQAYFLGANDPYKALQTTLRADINREAWESLHSDVSRPFPRPASGRIAVKVINHLGDEVMKVLMV